MKKLAQRHSTSFFAITATLLLLASGLLIQGRFAVVAAQPALENKANLVKTLALTDLCLFTEASYTRHLSQTDLNTPFQDSPLVLEHFPTGALVAPPSHLAVRTASPTLLVVRKHGQ